MSALRKKKLALITIVYWFLLAYIVAALVWWFIALQQQNRQATLYKLMELKGDDPNYATKVTQITDEEKSKTTAYVGEGITFMIVLLVGAVFVYRSVRKQIKLAHQQQNFIMAVTHELKTPIAVAKLNLETLQKHKLDEAKQQKLIQMTLQEAERLNTLANNILISSQLEGGGYKMNMEELDLSSLTGKSVHDYMTRFPERNWQVNIEDDLEITGDALLIEILVNNLIDNAIKYAPPKTAISVMAKKENNRPVIRVADEGPGVPGDEKKKIFERFYRIGNEANRKTKGTGLGLYLCKKIAADHNADISVTDNVPAGAIFTIHFTS